VDRDGNDVGGIRMPESQAPLATYTGWNLRVPEIGAADELFSMQGSWIPFARTRKDREKSGDPRLSMEERYQSREEYLEKFAAAGRSLVAAGFLWRRPAPLPPAHARVGLFASVTRPAGAARSSLL
jgi:hypothetical protein